MSVLLAVTDVLQLFAQGEPQVGVATLGQRLGWAKSTSSRVLLQMAELGMLERDPEDRQYRLGPLVRRLVDVQQRMRPAAREQAREALAALSARSGHAAHLSVLDGTDSVLLEHFSGPNPLQVMSPVGSRLPASVTAMGRALLSRLSEAEFRTRYGNNDAAALPAAPPRCPQTVGDLARQVAQVRRERSAAAVEEGLPGVAAVATTLLEPQTRTTLGLALSFPSTLVSASDIKRYRQELVLITHRIGVAIGDPSWSDASAQAGPEPVKAPGVRPVSSPRTRTTAPP
ncbi:MAG: IclR family transcriptional regulator [Ramlibacter sp.]|jgi:DNA-binding IclR family transcriptional regulator|uniref:IclR family transcriptional regulator n=1 Tax=Ramlibacter sp. TaxID=1917967 RepID=UPI0026148C9A|nr:IclR family transcriptional regulator [Ramlibacter sp.]MDB5751444.1 IclR family transcriptional regulator [Ramlibacter sp.]